MPARASLASLLGHKGDKKYISQLVVQHGSKLIEKTLAQSALKKTEDTAILEAASRELLM